MQFRRLTLAVALGCCPAAAWADPPPSITVQGSCRISVQPDRASLSAWAVRRAPDAGRATADAIAAYNRFRQDVEKLKLPDAVLNSTGAQTSRLTDEQTGKQLPTAYESAAGLQVETSDIAGLAQVMQTAANDRMESISPMDVFLSEALRDKKIAECLPRAAADAKAKAEQLLRGLGASLGGVIRIDGFDTGGTIAPRPLAATGAVMRMAVAAPAPELSAGPQTLTVTTSVTFLIRAP